MLKKLFVRIEKPKEKVVTVLKRSKTKALVKLVKFGAVFVTSFQLVSCSDIEALGKAQSRTVLLEINKSLSSQNCAKTSAEIILKQIVPTLVDGDEIIITFFDVTGVKTMKKITSTMINGKNFKKEIEDALTLNDGQGTPMGLVLNHIKEVAKTKKDEFSVFVIGDGFDEAVTTKGYIGKSLNLSKDIIDDFNKNVITLPHTVISFLMLHPDNEAKFKEMFNASNVIFHSSLCDSPKLANEDKEAIEKSFKLIEGGN